MKLTEIKIVNKYSGYLNILGICLNVVSGFLFLFMLRKLYWHAFGDEGFILLGYQKEQVLSPSLLNESFLIVRRLLPFLNEDSIIQLRIINFTLIFVGLLQFTLISAKWFKYRYENEINFWILSGVFFISGLICCPNALPTLHYNSIQTILFLFIFSFFLLFDLTKPSFWKALNAFLCGFLLVFAIFNYLSSGLCLLFILFILIFTIFNIDELKLFVLIVFFGLISGFIFYHFFVHNLFYYFSDLVVVFSGKSVNYIPSSLLEFITQALIYFTPSVMLYVIVQILYFKFRLVFEKYLLPIAISLVVFFLRFKTCFFSNNLVFVLLIVLLAIFFVLQFKYERYLKKFIFAILFFIVIALLYKFYRSISYYLIFLPWLLVLADIILFDSKILTKKRLVILLAVASIPVLCVLGTDCKLYEKISMFSPIYAFLFFLLILWNKKNVNSYRFIFYH